MNEQAVCALCGEPMPEGEEVFNYHGYSGPCPKPPKPKVFARPWPDPTPEMRASPEFESVWQCIKNWDISVPDAYGGYCGATGNHVRAILDALTSGAKS
jgi:hypothetical protein